MPRLAIAIFALLCLAQAPAQEQWAAALGAKPLQAPLVADVAEPRGLETIVVLESGAVRAFEADGKPLWNAELGPLAPGTQAALAPAQDQQTPLLAVPIAGGVVAALNAATGEPLWKTEPLLGDGPAWALLADFNGDKIPDVLVASASGKVAALDGSDGKILWEYPGTETGKLSQIAAAPSVADIDDDGAPEIFLTGPEGLLSLDAQGHERFLAPLDAAPLSAPVVSDVDDDARFEIYVVLASGKLVALDAAKGGPLWDLEVPGEDAAAPQLAIADLGQDEKSEIIVAGKHTTVVSGEGKLLFMRDAPSKGIAIGDANGDSEIEIVSTSGPAIELLDAALAPVSTEALPSPAQTGPVLAAINGASVLCIGDDNTLRAIRTGARLMPQLAPWPAPRRDTTGRASSLSAVKENDRNANGPQLASTNGPLGIATGFEDDGQVGTWKPQAGGGAIVRDEQIKASGASSLKVTPAAAELRVASFPVVASPNLRTVNASVLAKGVGARAFLAWERPGAKPVLQELRPADTTPEGWRRLRISGAAKPAGAKSVSMILSSAPGAPSNWDDVQATAQFLTVPFVEVYWNQVGYESKGPKRFTAASTFMTPQGKFRVLNEQGNQVFEGNTEPPKKVIGAFNTDWGKNYWRGDFSTFEEPGKYRIEIDIDGNTARSAPFEIGPDLMWTRLFTPLSGAITARRCTADANCPTPHCAWEEGDQRGCSLNAEHLRDLNEIYTMIQWRIFDKDKPLPQLAEEIKWGADHLVAMQKDSPEAAQGQDPHLVAAIAGAARVFPKETAYAETAHQMLTAPRKFYLEPLIEYCATLDLFVATHDETLLETLRKLYPGADTKFPESVVRYESDVDETVMVSFDLGKKLGERADTLLKAADNPFGVCAYVENGAINYFGVGAARADYFRGGNTLFLLQAARDVARAYRFTPKPEYLQFIQDQFNWILGNNPYGISFVEGLGNKNLSEYAFARAKFPRGVPIGSVAEGIRGFSNGVDRPFIDLSAKGDAANLTSACPVWNSIAFLDALANLKRVRMAGAQKAQP